MIPVDKVTALMLYLTFFLFLCLGTWFISHLKGRKKGHLPPLYELTSCEYCHFHYLSETGKRITSCPQCISYNKKN